LKSRLRYRFLLTAVTILRFAVALTFLFTGFVKAVDPMGTVIKLQEYLTGFHISLEVPLPLLVTFAVLLSGVEFCIGVFLFLGIHRRLSLLMAGLMLLVMTPLTLYLALYNPVKDCGCFGDALVLTNWQTFGKNVLLVAAVIFLRRNFRKVFRFLMIRHAWVVTLYSVFFILIFSILNLINLPFFDFRPYRVGVNIPQAMQLPEGAEAPEFETVFTLEKDGKQQTFTLDDYPEDTTWHFVDSETKLIKEGAVPAIQDFALQREEDGEDITDEVLADSGYTFLLIAPYLSEADDALADPINTLYEYCIDYGYSFYCVTSTQGQALEAWKDVTGADYPFCFADDVMLKTMVRSNPGLVLIKNGTIYGKWSAWNLPEEATLSGPLETLPLGQLNEMSPSQKAMRILLWYILPILCLVLTDRIVVGHFIYKRLRHKTKILNRLKQIKMRKKIVAGNWKMNMNLQEGVALATELKEALAADQPQCDVVICTPFIHLAPVAGIVEGTVIGLGAENCADKVKGAYTGEVSAEMVKSTGAQYVILGHSERRAYYGETAEILKEKVNLALENGLKVIFCIGEVLAEREANKQNEVVKAQLEGSLFDLTAEQFSNIILAYEPVWAIGTGKTATSDQAEEMHAFIRQTIAEKFGAAAAENVSILYGGSCKPSNAKEIFAKPDVDGGLIGGAALKVADFKGIIDAWKA
jgi:triosephosphate isomerase